jgi:hypothetical protein
VDKDLKLTSGVNTSVCTAHHSSIALPSSSSKMAEETLPIDILCNLWTWDNDQTLTVKFNKDGTGEVLPSSLPITPL